MTFPFRQSTFPFGVAVGSLQTLSHAHPWMMDPSSTDSPLEPTGARSQATAESKVAEIDYSQRSRIEPNSVQTIEAKKAPIGSR